MIRINLLREPRQKPKTERRVPGKILAVIAAVAVVAAAGGALWTFRASLFRKAPPSQKREITVNKEAAPSTFAKSSMLEDVVKEVSEEGRKISADGILHLAYGELSSPEKIDYEVLFAKNVVELLGRAVPGGIGLRSLEADNFQTLYAVGLAPSREMVENVFATLKAHNVTLLPRPLTQITANRSGGYRFALTGKTDFGLNLTDSMVDAPLPPNVDLARTLQSFVKTARENSITFVKMPAKVSGEKVGAYFRYVYLWSGTGTYKNFARFVAALHQARQYVAFKRISINALSGANVKIESRVIVTTRE